jgi:hypothetical protein
VYADTGIAAGGTGMPMWRWLAAQSLAVPCAAQSCAVLRYATLCYAILSCTTLCYAVLLRCATLCCAVLRCAALCCAVLRYVRPASSTPAAAEILPLGGRHILDGYVAPREAKFPLRLALKTLWGSPQSEIEIARAAGVVVVVLLLLLLLVVGCWLLLLFQGTPFQEIFAGCWN